MANFGRALQSVGQSNPLQTFAAVQNLGLSFEQFEARKKEKERREQPANINADPIFLNMPPAAQQLLLKMASQGGFSQDGNGTVGAKEDLLKKISDSPVLSAQFTRLKFEHDLEASQKANSDLSNAVTKIRDEGGDTSRNNPKIAKLMDAAELLGSRLGKTRGVNDKVQAALQGFNKNKFEEEKKKQQTQQAFSQFTSDPRFSNDPIIKSAVSAGDVKAAQKRAGEILKAEAEQGTGGEVGVKPAQLSEKFVPLKDGSGLFELSSVDKLNRTIEPILRDGEPIRLTKKEVLISLGKKVDSIIDPFQKELKKGLGKSTAKIVTDLRKGMTSAKRTKKVIASGRALLNKGVFTGAAANVKLQFNKYLRAAGVEVGGKKVQNTEAFSALLSQQVVSLLSSGVVGSGTGISDNDILFLNKVVGGDITLDEGAIRKIFLIQEQVADIAITEFNEVSSIIEGGGDEKDFFRKTPLETGDLSNKQVTPPARQQSISPEEIKKLVDEFELSHPQR